VDAGGDIYIRDAHFGGGGSRIQGGGAHIWADRLHGQTKLDIKTAACDSGEGYFTEVKA
jgi:hypothetical protein